MRQRVFLFQQMEGMLGNKESGAKEKTTLG